MTEIEIKQDLFDRDMDIVTNLSLPLPRVGLAPRIAIHRDLMTDLGLRPGPLVHLEAEGDILVVLSLRYRHDGFVPGDYPLMSGNPVFRQETPEVAPHL